MARNSELMVRLKLGSVACAVCGTIFNCVRRLVVARIGGKMETKDLNQLAPDVGAFNQQPMRCKTFADSRVGKSLVAIELACRMVAGGEIRNDEQEGLIVKT